jgi:cell division protein FtsB
VTKEIEYNTLWNVYPQNDEIQALILNHKSIIKENPLLMIQNQKSTMGILQSLTKKVKAINEFNQLADRIKTDILDLFIKTITEYEEKNLLLLESLANTYSSLHSKIETINEQLEGLKNGKNALEKANELLPYLSESFTYDLNSYTEISSLFTKALQESGKTNHLEWLESKLNGSDQGVLTVDDLKNPDLVKELLSIGLIKINIEKQF